VGFGHDERADLRPNFGIRERGPPPRSANYSDALGLAVVRTLPASSAVGLRRRRYSLGAECVKRQAAKPAHTALTAVEKVRRFSGSVGRQ